MNRKSKERYCKILAKRLENIDFLKFYDYNCVIGSWVINACETTPWETAGLTNAEALANLLNKIKPISLFNRANPKHQTDHGTQFYNLFFYDISEVYKDLEITLERLKNCELSITSERELDIRRIENYLLKTKLEEGLSRKITTTRHKL